MSPIQNIFATFNEWQKTLAVFGLMYLLKILFAIFIDLKRLIKTYILPNIGVASTNFKHKYGKWAVVTGCTQGIGLSYVEELAKRGMSIVLISRNQQKLSELAKDVKRKFQGIWFY